MITTSPVSKSPNPNSYSYSPTRSPRTSTSSTSSGIPLTPIYELDKMNSELIVSTEEVEDTNIPQNGKENVKPLNKYNKADLPSLKVPPPMFSNYSFGTSSPSASSSSSIGRTPSPLSSVDDVALPSEGFKFGTCSSNSFVGTPTAEQGPFEYPSSSSSMSTSPPLGSSPTSARRGSLALGMTHRRGSIFPPQLHSQLPDGISPPPTRRSSTCSTITTLPIAGRRPSIVHSTTVEVTLPQIHPSVPPFEEHSQPPSASSSRRPSVLMFPSKPLPTPIPPSLLSRRGSLPASQLFGLPTTDQIPNSNRIRSSYSSGSATISTASLYLRRQSVLSESEFSNSSSGTTVMEHGVYGETAGSRRPSLRPRTPSADFTPKTISATRRGSVSFFPPVPPQINQTPNRSSSLSSRSSLASNRSSTSTTSRIPINFSPRHPNSISYNSRHGSISSISNSNSSSSFSIPHSPKIGYPTSQNYRRHRHSTSGTILSNPGLSSSEEEDQEEELPSPNQSKLGYIEGKVASAPTFVDPWSSSNTPTIENKLSDLAVEDEGDKRCIPLETPPLETVLERPPLDTVDSGDTLRP